MKILFKDAQITTMKPEDPLYGFMVVEHGKILRLTSEYPEGSYDKILSLGNRHVYPTLCDNHLHLLYSIVLSSCSFNICHIEDGRVIPVDLDGIEASIREFAECNPHGPILVNQYIPSAIRERRLPYAEELDRWTNHREVIVFHMDGHSCSVSTALMKKLNLPSENGILSGAAYDLNQGRITSYAAGKVNLSTLAQGIANFQNQCLDYGITRVCALDGDDTTQGHDFLLDLLVLLARHMDIDVRLYPQYMNFERLRRYLPKMSAKRIGGCSIWELDGSIGSHSAAFPHPYQDTGASGSTYYEDAFIRDKLGQALEDGMQTTAHAIGTLAIDQLVDSYLANAQRIPSSGPWARIDHFEFPSEKAIQFALKNRIAITIQPGYAYIDKRYLHTYRDHLDPADLERILPLKRLADGGALLLGSSDSPVQSINPYEQMRGMMDYYLAEESISAYEAFRTYTCNSAIALDEADGQLYEGGPATFFTTDMDILGASPDTIIRTRAHEVYRNGRLLPRREGHIPELVKMLLCPGHKI